MELCIMHKRGWETQRRGVEVVRHTVEDRYIDAVATARNNMGGTERIRTDENITSARSCECGYHCPSGMAGHSPATTIVYRVIKPARGCQQSCRKRRCARFFHVVDALRTETALSDINLAHSATFARHRLSDLGKMRIFYLRPGDDLSDYHNHAFLFLPVTGICEYSINMFKRSLEMRIEFELWIESGWSIMSSYQENLNYVFHGKNLNFLIKSF